MRTCGRKAVMYTHIKLEVGVWWPVPRHIGRTWWWIAGVVHCGIIPHCGICCIICRLQEPLWQMLQWYYAALLPPSRLQSFQVSVFGRTWIGRNIIAFGSATLIAIIWNSFFLFLLVIVLCLCSVDDGENDTEFDARMWYSSCSQRVRSTQFSNCPSCVKILQAFLPDELLLVKTTKAYELAL